MAVDKLVDSAQLDTDLTSVANAIRTKGGTSASLAFPSGFVTAIGNISTGGTPRTSDDLEVSGATVTAPAGTYASAASKSVASGTAGTPTATKGTVSNHSVSVTPSVTNTTGYITGGTKTGTAVSVSASELVSGTYSVTSSGTKDVTNYASASVPAGTEGTPTATKSTVNNHSISVTPSVTNSGGYITGSTKTGTAVTVAASELVSGSETKTANGTYDVTNLAQLIVNVAGGGGSGLTYESGTYTPTADIARPTISFSNTHSKAPFLIYVTDASNPTTLTATSSIVEFIYEDTYMVNGYGYKVGSSGSTIRYGIARYSYISSSSNSSQSTSIQYNSDDQGDSSSGYARYWAKETAFWPSAASASRYFRSGRSYKWFAFFLPTT